MKYEKTSCEKCGCLIGKNNYKKHVSVCDGTDIISKKQNSVHLNHDGLICQYCGKECKNKNSLVQHEIRCTNNPERKSFNNFTDYIYNNRKGKNKYNCEEIAKQVTTTKNKYDSGWVSPVKGTHRNVIYVFEEHNNAEIDKWHRYAEGLNVSIPKYALTNKNDEYYPVISKLYSKQDNSVLVGFEHNFIANLYLEGDLQKINTVHHIDKNHANNDIHNLMVFETNNDHKRFHNSKYAWLIYNDITHKFTCELKKDN